MAEKVLEVKNLRISFRTNSGTVKAVRGISFDLYKGRTLAIVGESGSGKSVTSKAILGILANNKIVEDGQIIFDGKDLLKIDEETFTHIRGVKISMIFQDPLSSLNPIMKVGKQLTEAMYLKAKASKREAHAAISKLNSVLARYGDKTTMQLLHKTVSQMSIESEIIELDGFIDLFRQACEGSLSYQDEALRNLKTLVEEFKNKHFTSEESLDVKLAKQDLAKLKKPLKNAVYPLDIEPDDIIEVFMVLMTTLLTKFVNAGKHTEERQKLLEKYQANDVFDLPPEIRSKEREVILPPSAYFAQMVKAIDELLNHIDELLNTDKSLDTFVDEFKHTYYENIIQSKTTMTSKEAKDRAIELMTEVGIPDPERRFYQYPFEFSGGMRQRIVIAIALSSNPEVLICDEPTTALDVTIQAQILELINKLKVQKNLSIIFITHDLGVVANMADDIAVMYAGKIVEYGSVYDVFYDPRHPYTWALLGSMPDLDTKEKLDAIPGTPPNMLLPPRGDAFADRNKYALKMDYEAQPKFYEISPTHYAATWLLDERAPDVEAPKIVVERIKNAIKVNKDTIPTYTLKKNSILERLGGNK